MWCDVIGFLVYLFCFNEITVPVAVNSSWAESEGSLFLCFSCCDFLCFFFLQSKDVLVKKNVFYYYTERTKSTLFLL